ncbi:hypothetical protein T484DRAFT_3068691 [Baffinella frigidus]|nr:hypothetical protein T484DRAFT_3068691 [Cryptophyta sp. CCMP2293]
MQNQYSANAVAALPGMQAGAMASLLSQFPLPIHGLTLSGFRATATLPSVAPLLAAAAAAGRPPVQVTPFHPSATAFVHQYAPQKAPSHFELSSSQHQKQDIDDARVMDALAPNRRAIEAPSRGQGRPEYSSPSPPSYASGSSSSRQDANSPSATSASRSNNGASSSDVTSNAGSSSGSGWEAEREEDEESKKVLRRENSELKKRLRDSEDELERLRDVVSNIVESQKKQKVEDTSEEEAEKQGKRYWKDDEHERFLEALNRYGPKAVKAISDYVETRTPVQVRLLPSIFTAPSPGPEAAWSGVAAAVRALLQTFFGERGEEKVHRLRLAEG